MAQRPGEKNSGTVNQFSMAQTKRHRREKIPVAISGALGSHWPGCLFLVGKAVWGVAVKFGN